MPPAPVNVVDGIPDRSASPRRWKYLVIAAGFVAWVALLAACAIWGAP